MTPTPPGRLLVVNAGSSSLKLRWLDASDGLLGTRDVALGPGPIDGAALRTALADQAPPDAVGHRIVHGGRRYVTATRLDPAVLADLQDLVDLAPLHQPRSLAAVEAVQAIYPAVPAVACFDTAFHATIPPAAATYALPRAWRARWDLHRYGFHGLSHAYAARRAGEMLGRAPDAFRAVICHLGAGASLAAVARGVSVDTTMGFTPLEGLVMATRSGSVDPGLILWLERHVGMPPAELGDALEDRSGLLGLAGTADMAVVVTRAVAGDAAAGLALAVYGHRLRAGIAAMAAAMGGLEVLVFTGGVGERAAVVREAACDGSGFLGVCIDPIANGRAPGAGPFDRDISAPGAAVRTLVIEAREDLQIAREVRQVLRGAPG